jgi:hypothetical protein
MKALELRKQLLIAESELNRASLDFEWQSMVREVHILSRRAESISSMVKAAGALVSGLSSLRGKKPQPGAEKSSWWQAVLKGAGVASSFWSELRNKDEDRG